MSEIKHSYHQILKTTSLFGGVQLLTIGIAIVRTKLIAVFIGPTGMGIIALLNSAIGIIGGLSGLGIEASAVKHISADYENEDLNTVSVTVSVVKKLALVTGIFGSVVMLLFSNWLSIITFGNTEQVYSFMLLSMVLLFKQLSVAELAILQGLRKMRFLAKANLYGNILGLFVSVPLYYFYKIDAIVPTIIAISLASLLVSFYYSKKVRFERKSATKSELVIESKRIVKLGIMLTISGLLTLLTTYLIQIYIGNQDGLAQVGFYNAGFTLLNSYVGIIFTVMSTDFFPRLAAIIDESETVRTTVRQQSFLSILIITPIIILFLTLIPLIVKVVFTPQFAAIIPMVCYGILAMLFRAVSWSMGYILIAKGDSKMFLQTAIGFNIISLILNVLGYYFYGLEGLGISFLVYYLVHFFGLQIITKKRYGFYFDREFYQIYLVCIAMCAITFLCRYIPNLFLKYSIMAIMVVLSIVFVVVQMNKKMELKEFFNAIIKNKK